MTPRRWFAAAFATAVAALAWRWHGEGDYTAPDGCPCGCDQDRWTR